MMSGLFKKKVAVAETNEYSDSECTMTEEEAHRNVRYELPSVGAQFTAVYRSQLKLFAKGKIIWMMLIVVAAIPLIVYSGMLDSMSMWQTSKSGGPGDYMSGMMGLMPILMSILPSVLLSRMIPEEFKTGTAFMDMALPQKRSAFYLAKFLAGFTMVFFVIALGYGVMGLMVVMEKGDIDAMVIGKSFAVAVTSAFAISAISFCISTFLKRATVLVPIALFYFIIPGLTFAMMLSITSTPFDEKGLGLLMGMAEAFPAFSGEVCSSLIGGPSFSFSILGLITFSAGVDWTVDVMICILTSLIWGIAALGIGLMRFVRREI
jgi:ABC-type transport system involved in multi-copper enzyme maturation permease subunit